MSKRQNKKKAKAPSSTLASLPSTPTKEPTMDANQKAIAELTETNKDLQQQLVNLRELLTATEKLLESTTQEAKADERRAIQAEEELAAYLEDAKKREDDMKQKSLVRMKELREEFANEKTILINAHAAELSAEQATASAWALKVKDLQQQLKQSKDKGKQNMSDKQTIDTLKKEIEQLKQQLKTSNEGKTTMSKEMEALKKQIEQLKKDLKEARDINTSKEEAKQEIESLRTKLKAAQDDGNEAKQQLDKQKEELLAVTKWNSKHTMKVAGAVVGMIVLVAGVAYIVRRVLSNGEAEVEAIDTEAAPELSVVNY